MMRQAVSRVRWLAHRVCAPSAHPTAAAAVDLISEDGASRESLIDYPCDFPIKVLGRAPAASRRAVLAVVREMRPISTAPAWR